MKIKSSKLFDRRLMLPVNLQGRQMSSASIRAINSLSDFSIKVLSAPLIPRASSDWKTLTLEFLLAQERTFDLVFEPSKKTSNSEPLGIKAKVDKTARPIVLLALWAGNKIESLGFTMWFVPTILSLPFSLKSISSNLKLFGFQTILACTRSKP